MTNPEEIAQSDNLKILEGEITIDDSLEKFKNYLQYRIAKYRPNDYDITVELRRDNQTKRSPKDSVQITCVLKAYPDGRSVGIALSRIQISNANMPFVFPFYEMIKAMEDQIMKAAFSGVAGEEFMAAARKLQEENNGITESQQ